MVRVVVLLSHIGHTTISYDLTERLARDTDANVTVISYGDPSIEDIEVPVNTGAVNIEALGAQHRFDPDAIRQLRRLLTTGEFDLLQTHHNFVGTLGRALAPRDLAIVNTEHANHRLHYTPAQNAVNATTLWRADRVVANSQATLQSFYPYEQVLVPKRKQRVIYNGIDLTAIDAACSGTNPWMTERPRIVTVGRMIETKNQRALITAFNAVQASIPDAELVLVGDGPQRKPLEHLADHYGLTDHVQFTGTVSRMDVYQILNTSDVFALPSRSEGFCVALVEAMACGVAPTVSDIPVLREVAGESAAFVDPDTPKPFAQCLLRLLSDADHRRELSRAAEQRARTQFPLEKTVREYYTLYEELI